MGVDRTGGLIGFNQGSVTLSDDGVAGLDDDKMRDPEEFVGWDFDAVWDIVTEGDGSYPFLQDNLQSPRPGVE